ncbi:MAG: CPBP family glutamic-type intramembrane protease [Pricia sp.]
MSTLHYCKDYIKRYEIWVFLMSAPILNTLITYTSSLGYISEFIYGHGRFYALLFLLFCIVGYTKGTEGLLNLFRPMLRWKVHPKWYLFSLLFALVIATITLLLKAKYLGEGHSTYLTLQFPSARNSFFILTWAFLGEVVWISYAVRELSKIMNPFYASQIIGIFWTLWWVPSVYINVGVIEDLPLWPLFLNMMGAAGMCTFVYEKTKSGLCVLLLQYMLNMSILLLPVSPLGGGIPTYSTFAVLYFLTMLVFMYFRSPRKMAALQ